jgi:hypothetical protein
MNCYCIDLNLNEPLLKSEELLSEILNKRLPHSRIDVTCINQYFVELLKSKGLKITLAESFFRAAYSPDQNQPYSQIHKDTLGISDSSKINWIYGGANSKMNWYAPLNGIAPNISGSAVGMKYEYYYLKDLEFLHSQEVGRPSLVQVGLPHSISNIVEDRLCLSVRYADINTGEFITFDKAIDIFKTEIN